MLPENFAEQHIRIYFRKNDPESVEKAKRLVNPLLLQILQTCQVKLVLRDGPNNGCLSTSTMKCSSQDVTPGNVA